MPRRHPGAVGLLLPFIVVTAVAAAATPASGRAAAATTRSLCSCGGVGSVGRAMDGAALVAIAVLDDTARDAATADSLGWPLRIERAWRWPGGGSAPPRRVVVVPRPGGSSCAIRISPGERQVVVAWVRPADAMLELGHKCATPWGAVDTLGPTAADVRRFGGDGAMRAFARDRERLLDSLRTHGPGIEPSP